MGVEDEQAELDLEFQRVLLSTEGKNYLKVFPSRMVLSSHATLVGIGRQVKIWKGQQKLRILQLSSQYSTP